MDTQQRAVRVGENTFDVRIGGPEDGKWVLLLHGFPVNSSCFDAVVPRLHESGLRTIVFDQRGYSPGARPDGTDAYHLSNL
ncbi:alpha/beta hydrolase, partial [Streptomyces sp. SID10244]|nr:alpha/beta hydrolase [Streptomyces sp. SID10244]